MFITFGQYNVLAATRYQVTRSQLAEHTAFNDLMVSYYMTGLLAHELIVASDDKGVTRYHLTEAGISCLTEYERHNPELAVSRTFSLSFLD